MQKLVFGSLNIDKMYQVYEIVKPGETMMAESYAEFCGGKGLNQAIALARAGSDVSFAGAVGSDGGMLTEMLRQNGIDDSAVLRLPGVSGHAAIQVDRSGQNCILVCSAANGMITKKAIDSVLSHYQSGDLLVLQNEISNVDYAIRRAREIGMVIALNPSPITPALLSYPIELVDYLILNEVEGQALAQTETEAEILELLAKKYPSTSFILTLGKKGALYQGKDGCKAACGVLDVPVVDTTAAGDTFCGYFLHAITSGSTADQALKAASAASNIAITKHGAEPSIPDKDAVSRTLESAVFLAPPSIK